MQAATRIAAMRMTICVPPWLPNCHSVREPEHENEDEEEISVPHLRVNMQPLQSDYECRYIQPVATLRVSFSVLTDQAYLMGDVLV
jgi:hypothetical protein